MLESEWTITGNNDDTKPLIWLSFIMNMFTSDTSGRYENDMRLPPDLKHLLHSC